ncbi:MAG: peptidoglycan DD-metalloendopeptidase family protein [Pseudomonadota bacterium]
MPRPVSPLLHDYKQASVKKPKQGKGLRWFALGLGIPVLAVLTYSGLSDTPESPPIPPQEPVMSAMDAPPPADMPLVEPVAGALIPDAEIQPAADTPPQPEYETLALTIKKGDTLDGLFRKNRLNVGHLAVISKLEEARKRFRRLKPGDTFEIQHVDGDLIRMYSALDLTSALTIARGEDDGFTAEITERPIEIRKRMAYGVIKSSLFESGAAAGLSDRTVMNVAGIFAWDIDFVLDIRVGDSFYVQYEEIWQDGEYVTDGEIVAAEFNNVGDSYRAVRFKDESGRSDYFTPEGYSVRKAFMRAPVNFTRISSNFNPNRRHPILNTIRAHRGVDYAAPRGTPIMAAGNGKVIFRGTKSGYGKTVILQHGGNITTLYAHMSNFAAKAPLGARVKQGDVIGFVGATGLATANHLHYEYRLNGVHRNPRTVALPKADPIDAKYRDSFLADVAPIIEELEQFKRTQLASAASNLN